MLNLYKLEIFYIVCLHGSFSAAADQLYMTQSAVSQHIQELESTLGVKLFNRGRRGVTLTQRGQILFDYAERLLKLAHEAENKVTDVSNLSEGKTHIGSTPTIGIYLVPQWLQTFRQQYKQLTVSLTTSITDHIVRDIQMLKLELAFVEGTVDVEKYDSIAAQVLEVIEWFIVVAPNHPWWTLDDISLDMLNECGIIMRQQGSHTRMWIDEILTRYKIEPRITAEFDNPESIKQALYSGDNVTLLPQYTFVREREMGQLRALAIRDVSLTRELSLVWNKKHLMSPISRAFLFFMKSYYPIIEEATID